MQWRSASPVGFIWAESHTCGFMGTQGPLSKSAAPFLFVALVLRALVGPAKELRARQLLHAIAPNRLGQGGHPDADDTAMPVI